MSKYLCALLFVGLALAGLKASAAPLMLDDFENPNPAGVLLIGVNHDNGKPYQSIGAPVTLGDQRDVKVEVLGAPKPNSAQVLIGRDDQLFNQGVFQFATASTPASVAILQYDGMDTNIDDLDNAESLRQLVLPDGGIWIQFLSVDAPVTGKLDLAIRLTSNGVGATYTGSVDETGTPVDVHIPYSTFDIDSGFDFAAVSSFEFVFNAGGQIDVDLVVGQIWTTVPEPSTISLGLLGLALAVARRRFRR